MKSKSAFLLVRVNGVIPEINLPTFASVSEWDTAMSPVWIKIRDFICRSAVFRQMRSLATSRWKNGPTVKMVRLGFTILVTLATWIVVCNACQTRMNSQSSSLISDSNLFKKKLKKIHWVLKEDLLWHTPRRWMKCGTWTAQLLDQICSKEFSVNMPSNFKATVNTIPMNA